MSIRKSEAAQSCSSCLKKYQAVYNDIASILEEDKDYDFGTYGPIFVRLAWHSSGTYDKADGTGGSNKATMRFEQEANHGDNKGLHIARDKLEKIKQKHPWISYGDLWTLAGTAAIQQMGGPSIPWRPGRTDGTVDESPPEGRLPHGHMDDVEYLRSVFDRMGFNDQEMIALAGAHVLGKCHTDRSGFDGPWTATPTKFSNQYFIDSVEKTWVTKKWDGPDQYVDKEEGKFMMLPADKTMSYEDNHDFRKLVEMYAKDEPKWLQDFSLAWKKLIELGVPFEKDTPELKFKTFSG